MSQATSISSSRTARPVPRVRPRFLPRPGFLMLLVLPALLCVPPGAQAAVTFNAQVGFDNNEYIEGHWAPVTISLNNTGPEDFVGEVEVLIPEISGIQEVSPHSFRRPVELPAPRSTKDIHLSIFFPDKNVSEVVVQLRKGRRVFAEPAPQKVNVIGYRRDERTYAYVDEDSLQRLRAMRDKGLSTNEELHFMRMHPHQFPQHSAAYEGLHGVFLGDFGPEEVTSPEARRALENYIRSGGNLIVFAGRSGDRYRGTWIEELLPVQVYSTRTVEGLASFTKHYGGELPPSLPFVITEAEARDGARAPEYVLETEDGLPLVARGKLGAGKVTFVAFDPDSQSFAGYTQLDSMLTSLLLSCQAIPQIGMLNEEDQATIQIVDLHSRRLEEQLRLHPAMQIPNFTFMGGFLVLYVIILGPVNYILLKKKKRLELAWVTVPLIVLLFSAGAYAVGRFTKGNEVLVHSMTFLRGEAGFPGLGYESYFGLFSPTKTSYDLRVQDGEALLREYRDPGNFGRGMRVQFGDEVHMQDYGMNMWTMDTFAASGFWPGSDEEMVSGEVILEGNTARGEIRNLFSFDLTDCHLVVGNEHKSVGELPAGETYAFEGLNLRNQATSVQGLENILAYKPDGTDRRHEYELASRGLRLALQESFTEKASGATLWGWADARRTSIPEVDVGRPHDREGATLVKIGMPITTNWGVVPFGIARRQLLAAAGTVQERKKALFVAEGGAVFEFQLPPGLDPERVSLLDVYYRVANTHGLVYELAVYNWEKGMFDQIAYKNATMKDTVTIDGTRRNPADYVRRGDPVINIRLRLPKDDQQPNTNFMPWQGESIDGKPAISLVEMDVRLETRQ